MGDACACNVGFSALYFDHPIIYGRQRMMTKGVMEVRDLHEQAETGQILVLTWPSGTHCRNKATAKGGLRIPGPSPFPEAQEAVEERLGKGPSSESLAVVASAT